MNEAGMNSIQSMTGFGRAEAATDSYRIRAELRSVNHRYLELSVKMPWRFNCFEPRIRKLLQEYFSRGKTDLFLAFEDYTAGSRRPVCNRALAGAYLEQLRGLSEELGLPGGPGLMDVARMPEVFSMEEESGDEEELWSQLEPVLRKAAEAFRAAREAEGDHLRRDLLQKLEQMEQGVDTIEASSPSVVEDYRDRMYTRLREALEGIGLKADEDRIVTETAIYADKVCTDEEMVRLRSHIVTMRKKLEAGGACGRELDFLAQEMNREANTTLSKAKSLPIADTAIALKTAIEMIREQVQNLE